MFNPKSPIPQWVADLERREMLDVNEAALKFWDLSREEFMTAPFHDLIHPDEMPRWAKWAINPKWGETGPWKCLRGRKEVFYCTIRWQMIDWQGRRVAFVFPVRAGAEPSKMKDLVFRESSSERESVT